MDAPTITLGGIEATLTEPSPILVYALAGASPGSMDAETLEQRLALGCAALHGCWPKGVTWPTRPPPRPWRIGRPVMEYGAEVFDALVRSGLDVPALADAGMQARLWGITTVATEEQMAEVEGNSEAPTGA